jgi:hypothetical protein
MRRRVTPLGWALLAAVIVTAILAVVAPDAAMIVAVALALVLLAVLGEGLAGVPGGRFDVGVAAARRREVLARFFRRGRPEWETTAPDFADEPQDAIFERERQRRGLR